MDKRVLFIYTNYSSFVKADDKILSEQFTITKYHFKPVKGPFSTAIELLKQFFYLLFSIWKFEHVYIWFADSHSFLPVIFSAILKKRSYIIIGGFDAVSLPYLKYGLFSSGKLRKFLGRTSIKYASFLLPVDPSLIKSINYYATSSKSGLPVGIKNFVKGIKGKIIAIPTGYDSDFWNDKNLGNRDKSIVTVGFIPDWQRWKLKGCDLMYEMAKKLPEFDFYIYGISNNFLNELKYALEIPSNLILLNKVKTEELPNIYSKHKVYAQFSLSEGLPNVLCEAVLCGCIPIGSSVNGIKTIILDSQLLLPSKSVDTACNIAIKAMEYPHEKFQTNYEYVLNTFTIENRKKAILSLFYQEKSH